MRRSRCASSLRRCKIVLDVMQTPPAIRMYNIMVGERRRVAAGADRDAVSALVA